MDNNPFARLALPLTSIFFVLAGVIGLAGIWLDDDSAPVIGPGVLALMCVMGMVGLGFAGWLKR